MGRRLPGLFREAGLTEIIVEPVPVLLTDLPRPTWSWRSRTPSRGPERRGSSPRRQERHGSTGCAPRLSKAGSSPRSLPSWSLAANRSRVGSAVPGLRQCSARPSPAASLYRSPSHWKNSFPRDQIYRRLEATLDLSFVRDWTQERYDVHQQSSINLVVFFTLKPIMVFGDPLPAPARRDGEPQPGASLVSRLRAWGSAPRLLSFASLRQRHYQRKPCFGGSIVTRLCFLPR